ncbi:MAG TPA: MCE family protein [Spirochaetes bacterium]|nr:MCE family protein [Spirochaetota bacterium]
MAAKFKHLEKIVGVFLTVIILAVIAVIAMIGREQRWFEKQKIYSTKFFRGEGLSPGMLVAIKGIQIGEVKTVYLNEDNWIEVTFSVYEEYADRIRKDSVVKINAPLIGAKVVEIIPGGKDMPVLETGSLVWSKDTEEGSRILKERKREEIPDEITRIINNIEILTYNLSSSEGSLNKTFDLLNEFLARLASEEGSLNKTLGAIEDITTSISQSKGSLGKFMDDNYELYDNVISLMEQLNLIMADFREVSRTVADSSPEIKAAIERSNVAMDEATGLIMTLQENFFVKGFSSRKESETLPIDNAEREGDY